MSRHRLLSGAAIGVLFTAAAHAQTASSAQAAATGDTPGKAPQTENVIVTAQRRSQNLQDVPISIQVLSGAALKRLNVENFDDLLQQLPNVTAGGIGPGQENVYC